MLKTLTITNVILIDRLEIDFSAGLCVLTGETGAGKSILLDALSLALGERANAALVRPGATQAVVAAQFELPGEHRLRAKLEEHGLLPEQEQQSVVMLRRSVNSEGKSKAYINDQPVSVTLLKELANDLVEIHGQFDQILQPSIHRTLLDGFGHYHVLQQQVATAFHAFNAARLQLKEAEKFIAEQKNQEEFLTFAVAEFDRLNPQPHEEEALIEKRLFLQNQAKILEGLQLAHRTLSEERGTLDQLGTVLNTLERIAGHCGNRLEPILETLNRAHSDLVEAESQLTSFHSDLDAGEDSLENVESRLYELRALARKHGCLIAELPSVYEKFCTELKLLQGGEASLENLRKAYTAAQQSFVELARALSQQRHATAVQLAQAVEAELGPLKLDKAAFKVEFQDLPEAQWNENGLDHVEFFVKTNPGLPFGAIAKTASGGERSRFMLALKVVLAHSTAASILVFDEIDSGVGGAVASAIGERLAKLGRTQQILAITHSPQVASYATQHFYVQKVQDERLGTTTSVSPLEAVQRLEEIARMLSAEEITQEARAAAEQLLTKAKMVA
jgi:DNA repair protein RecN (Recombination protein N)